MGNVAVADALEGIRASIAALTAEVDGSASGSYTAADPLGCLAEGCLDVLIGVAAAEAQLAALKAHATAKYAETARCVAPPDSPVQAQEMAIAAEIGCVLSIGDRAAGMLLAQSHALTTSLPRTLGALQGGSISWQHARVMIDETAGLNSAGAAALEAHFLDPNATNPAKGSPVGEMPAYRFRHKARVWRERHHAESIEARHIKSVADRRISYAPDNDGMAWISAYLPAHQASAVWNRATAAARGMQGPDESRTLTQLRVDVFTGWLLGGTAAEIPSPAPQVLVTVPVFSLLGATDEPAMLDGYGPIPASMARRLVADGAGSFHRVLVDPRDGAPLDIGRTSYRLTKAMKQALRLRDGKCTFPGCNNHSLDNEADHLTAWQHGGTTGISNLAQLCPKHHRLKHNSRWTPTPATKTQPPGWTSPTGRHYKPEHHDWEPPWWPGNPEQLQAVPDGPPGTPPDLAYIGQSPAEDAIDQFLHACP